MQTPPQSGRSILASCLSHAPLPAPMHVKAEEDVLALREVDAARRAKAERRVSGGTNVVLAEGYVGCCQLRWFEHCLNSELVRGSPQPASRHEIVGLDPDSFSPAAIALMRDAQ